MNIRLILTTTLVALFATLMTSCQSDAFKPIKFAHINSVMIEELPGDLLRGSTSLHFEMYSNNADLRSSVMHDNLTSAALPLQVTFQKQFLIETAAYVLEDRSTRYSLDAIDQNGDIQTRVEFSLMQHIDDDEQPSTVEITQNGMRITLRISWKNSGPVKEG